MLELPRRSGFSEDYRNLHCSIRNNCKNVTIVINNNDNDLSDLLKILNKYNNSNVEIKNITTLSELNQICSLLGNYDYSGKVLINLIGRNSWNVSLTGLINNKFINLESLPDYAKIKGFYLNNKQADFTSWAHNLNLNDKNTLMKCLTEEDKYIFSGQEKVIKSFYEEFIKEYPDILSLDERKRFEFAFVYILNNIPYDFSCVENDGQRPKVGCDWSQDAIETYKRRKGICEGRANLLTLVTNNPLLKCNSASIDGQTEPSDLYKNGQPHSWNVFIDKDGSAYYYDLSFKEFTRREIHDIGKRRLDRIFYSNVKEILNRPLIHPRRDDSPKVRVLKPLPPRREEQ